MKPEVPVGWRRAKLGELCDVLIGGTPSRAVDAYWDALKTSGNRWVSIADMKGHVVSDTKEFLSDEGVANSNVKRIRRGTVMMSFKLTIGRTAFAGCDLYTNEAIAAFVPKTESLDNNFLFHALPIVAEGGDVDQAIKGKTLNKAKLVELRIPLPPLAEQKKIAAILSSVDEAIRANEAVIEQTRRVKEGLLQELLTDAMARYPAATMRDLCVLITKGTTPPKDAYVTQGGVPFLRVGNLSFDGDLHTSELLFVSPSVHSSLLKRSMLYTNDVLTNIVGPPLGQVSVVPRGYSQWNMNQAVAVFRADESRTSPLFISALLQWERTKEWLKSRGKQTSGQVNLTLELCGSAPACLPPIEVQRAIGTMIQAVDDVRRASGTCVSSLQSTKSGLLQDLLTGKVRVTP
jgi:type I restriction enzyme S subunit